MAKTNLPEDFAGQWEEHNFTTESLSSDSQTFQEFDASHLPRVGGQIFEEPKNRMELPVTRILPQSWLLTSADLPEHEINDEAIEDACQRRKAEEDDDPFVLQHFPQVFQNTFGSPHFW